MPNREFYHESFVEALVDMYVPVMYDLMVLFYEHSCSQEGMTPEKCMVNFKELLKEKTEKVKSHPEETYSAVMKNTHEHSRIVSAASINYRRLHSSDNGISVKKLDDSDLFSYVFIAVSKMLYKYPYLLVGYGQDPKLEDCIEKAVRHGVNQCFKIMFIDDDRVKMIKNLEISKNGKRLNINNKKLLEIFEREGVNIEELIEDSDSDSGSESDSDTKSDSSSSSEEVIEVDTVSEKSREHNEDDDLIIEKRPKVSMLNRGQEAKQIILTI